jgi:cysteinyl-tRNA synthetase
MVMGVTTLKARHAELVSASIAQPGTGIAEKWTLKQVQGDERLVGTMRFEEALFDDLNTPEAVTSVEWVLSLKDEAPETRLAAIAKMDSVLGLNLLDLTRTDLRIRPVTAVIIEAEIEAALAARKEARTAKDFARSDAIRDDLIAKGVEVMDGDPLGWDWKLDV